MSNAKGKSEQGSSFMIRLRSSVILMAVTIAAIVSGGYVLFGVIFIITMIGMMELYRAVGVNKSVPGAVGYLAGAAYLILVLFGQTNYLLMLSCAFIIVLMGAYVLSFPKYNSEQISMIFLGLFYVAVTLSFIYRVRISEGGAYTVWLIFIGAWGSDTCAYVVGRKFGKHKVAPELSPKKTVEGCIGGMLGAALIGFIYALIFKEEITGMNALIVFPVTGALGSIISQIGDMAASGIKRNKNLKDYGRLIPGHGGVLDRFDSVIFIAPICYYLIEAFKI